jgi:hypothetical protein
MSFCFKTFGIEWFIEPNLECLNRNALKKKFVCATELGMNSIWLWCEPESLESAGDGAGIRTQSSGSPPFLGVFTEDPAIIGARLPRPITPGLGAQPLGIDTTKVLSSTEWSKAAGCESPPTVDASYDFKAGRSLVGPSHGISFF